MEKYKDFKEYMEDNYIDVIMGQMEPYIISHKDVYDEENFYTIK